MFNFIRNSSKLRGGHGLFGSYAGYVHVMGGPTNVYINFYATFIFVFNL